MSPIDLRQVNAAFIPHVRVVPASVAKSRVSPLVQTHTPARRTCNWCGKPFDSTGPGNRKCPKCTQYTPSEWGSNGGAKKRIWSGADTESD